MRNNYRCISQASQARPILKRRKPATAAPYSFGNAASCPGHRDDGTAGVPLSREEASETRSRTIHEPAFRNFPLEP